MCRNTNEREIQPRSLFEESLNKRQTKQLRKSELYQQEVHEQIKEALKAFEDFRNKKTGIKRARKPEEIRVAQGFTETQIVPFHLLHTDKERKNCTFKIKLETCEKPTPTKTEEKGKKKPRATWNVQPTQKQPEELELFKTPTKEKTKDD